jgi:enoyl-CoA hydratase
MISIHEEHGVGHIILERAGALNALSREFCRAIDEAAKAFDHSATVRAILISSSLKHFCAGADIREMAEMKAEEARATGFIGCVEYVDKITKPLIVAVNGLAAGGGCELVEMCDIVIAGESARFCHPEITLAAMPGAGGTQRLARAVGKHVAMDMLLTGRPLDAREALAAGLVSRIAADAALLATARAVATQVAALSSPVAARIKASVMRAQVGLDEGLELEGASFRACFDEEDFREGLSAFVAKRKPEFIHR